MLPDNTTCLFLQTLPANLNLSLTACLWILMITKSSGSPCVSQNPCPPVQTWTTAWRPLLPASRPAPDPVSAGRAETVPPPRGEPWQWASVGSGLPPNPQICPSQSQRITNTRKWAQIKTGKVLIGSKNVLDKTCQGHWGEQSLSPWRLQEKNKGPSSWTQNIYLPEGGRGEIRRFIYLFLTFYFILEYSWWDG